MFLVPAEDTKAASAADALSSADPDAYAATDSHEPDTHSGVDNEYVKLSNQFVVPIMGSQRVEALVVASLSVEVVSGTTQTVYLREPKLRDVFLQVLFDHANIGGFEGPFTAGDRMDILRSALLDAARSVLGPDVKDVLITEIARQDA
jgi:hypothetical protein